MSKHVYTLHETKYGVKGFCPICKKSEERVMPWVLWGLMGTGDIWGVFICDICKIELESECDMIPNYYTISIDMYYGGTV